MLLRLMRRRHRRDGLVLLVLLLPAIFFVAFYQMAGPPAFILEHPYFQYDLSALEPRNGENQRCVLPRIHPFDSSIWGYLSPTKNIVCKSKTGDLTTVDKDGWLKFNESKLQITGYEVDKSLRCYWSKVRRGGGPGKIDDVVSYGSESPVPKEGLLLPPDAEIFRVVCRNFLNFAVYDMVHAHIHSVKSLPVTPGTASNFVNVLIFGLDSMSRLSFIRLLPLTYKYLTEDLKMTVLRGMNRVGDNSYPNLIALLTGKSADGGDLPNNSLGYDNWPIIWKNYSQAGYATMWAEDFPDYGLFNYLATGFREVPTLHYLRPFWLALKESHLLQISSHMCYGATPRHLLQMEYLRQFISTYSSSDIPQFSFSFLTELTHDSTTRVSSTDGQFRDFFRWFADSGQLDQTLLIVMSDHGHRFNPIRKTRVGRFEENNPFFAIRIPKPLTSRQPLTLTNLVTNSGRLVTPFDVYATLEDLVEFVVKGRALGVSPSSPGILGQSLFREIPADRTCKDASVPVHYCVCETATKIDASDSRSRFAADIVVEHINELLKEKAEKCSKLNVSGVLSAQLVKTMEDSEDGAEQKVRVVLEVEPSKALFEGTVIVRGDTGEVWGDVSRINRYAGQSDCIEHVILRKFCFCSELLDKNTSKDKLQ